MATPDHCRGRRRAVTLIELLVVVAVLAILLAAVLNLMQPVVKEMKVRESARMVDSYLAGAQARAKELGRPVAVYIEPFVRKTDSGTEATGAAYQMFIAETPPPFAGDDMDAQATISDGSRSQATLTGAGMLSNYQDDELVGGFIRFGYRGHFYEIKSRSGTTVKFLSSASSGLDGHPAEYQHPPAPGKMPYQIFPRPIKTSVTPLDIPEPLAIDLQNSGFDKKGGFKEFKEKTKKPVIISFGPTGVIDRVYGELDGDASEEVHQPTGAVHLLVGWAGQLGTDNLKDFTVRWVSISHATGRIVTSENAAGSNPRKFAEDALGMGSGS